MNLRDIKKDIQYVVGAFIDDCTLFLNMNPGKNADEITGLIDKAVDLYNDLRDKVAKGADAIWTSARNSWKRPTPSTTNSAPASRKAWASNPFPVTD